MNILLDIYKNAHRVNLNEHSNPSPNIHINV